MCFIHRIASHIQNHQLAIYSDHFYNDGAVENKWNCVSAIETFTENLRFPTVFVYTFPLLDADLLKRLLSAQVVKQTSWLSINLLRENFPNGYPFYLSRNDDGDQCRNEWRQKTRKFTTLLVDEWLLNQAKTENSETCVLFQHRKIPVLHLIECCGVMTHFIMRTIFSSLLEVPYQIFIDINVIILANRKFFILTTNYIENS